MTKPLSIPNATTPPVVEQLFALDESFGLTEDDALTLTMWLLNTQFDGQNFWVGQLAAALIRDRGTERVRIQIRRAVSDCPNEWTRYLLLYALCDAKTWSDIDDELKRAALSKEAVIRQFANQCLEELGTAAGQIRATLGKFIVSGGADSCVLYVRDESWQEEFRVLCRLGVSHSEPMHGFLRTVRKANTVQYVQAQEELDSQTQSESDRLFGSYAVREGIRSSALFPLDNGRAVLYVNFKSSTAFDADRQRALSALAASVARLLPSAYHEIRQTGPLPLDRLVRILDTHRHLSTTDWENYFRTLLTASLDAFAVSQDSGFGTIHMLDHENRVLRLVANAGHVDSLDGSYALSLERGEGVVSWVAAKGQSILIEDLNASGFRAIFRYAKQRVRSQMAVPMIVEDRVIGVFSLESVTPRAFSPGDARVMWFAANQAATAFILSNQEERAMRSAAEDFLRSLDPRVRYVSLDHLASKAREALQAYHVDIWKYNPDSASFDESGSTDPNFGMHGSPRDQGWSQFIYHSRSPVWIGKIGSEQLFSRRWSADAGVWEPISSGERIPDSVNPALTVRQVQCELGIPIVYAQYDGDQVAAAATRRDFIGVMWLKYTDDRAPLLYRAMRSALWLAENAGSIMAHKSTVDARRAG